MKWKLTRAGGGGVIADLASHAMDLLAFLGAEPTGITACSDIVFATRPAADDPDRRVEINTEDHLCALVHARFADQPQPRSVVESMLNGRGQRAVPVKPLQ